MSYGDPVFHFSEELPFPPAATPFGTVGAPCHGSSWALSWPLHLCSSSPHLICRSLLQHTSRFYALVSSSSFPSRSGNLPQSKEKGKKSNTMRAFWRLCTVPHVLCAQSKTIRCPHLITWKLNPGLVLLLQSASQVSMAIVLRTMPQNLMVLQRLGRKKKKKTFSAKQFLKNPLLIFICFIL